MGTTYSLTVHIVMVIGKYTDVFREIFWLGLGRLGEEVTWEHLSMEEFVKGEENFHEGVQDFLALLKTKNNEKLNMKKFFQLKVRSSIKS